MVIGIVPDSHTVSYEIRHDGKGGVDEWVFVGCFCGKGVGKRRFVRGERRLLHFLQSLTLHTNYGDLKIELECGDVPKLCRNFIALAASGYYNKTVFHKNVAGAFLQGGDPTGTGKGGEAVRGGYLPDEISTVLRHDKRGVVSMAHRAPDENGSQFFITYAPQVGFDGLFSIIGTVIDGWETLDAIEALPVVGKKAKPTPGQEARILSVSIHANPFAEADIEEEGGGGGGE